MIRHTVCFSLVHPVDSELERGFLVEAAQTLPAIPGVHDFTVSRQVGAHSDLRFQFEMSFDGEAEYAAYNAHPDHLRFVATRWTTEVATFQELDFVPFEVGAA